MFSLPSGFIASTSQFIALSFLDLKELIILGFGVALDFYVINRLINLLKEGMGK